jgi:hypothetical protein
VDERGGKTRSARNSYPGLPDDWLENSTGANSTPKQKLDIMKSGLELKVGDTIKVWWGNGRDTIIALRKYDGALASLWEGKAQIADFALNKVGMTIEPELMYETSFP